MVFRRHNLLSFVSVIFLWRLCKIKAYVDVCEYTPLNFYCNCEEPSYRDSLSYYKVSCIILQNVEQTDSVWRSLGDAENISYLKLQPRLPITLEYIPSELKRMPNLKYLKIQEGRLGTLKPYAVSGFKSLEELELEGNDIVALEPNSISSMSKLKKLTLSANAINEILADSLSDVLELEILFLDRNNISRIETCAFCNLQNLKELELWDNQLSDLTEYTFRGLRYLRRLDLYKNKIRLLNDKVFHTMERLIELDLRENMINYISARAFNGLDKLQVLSLGNNMIKVLPDEVFAPLSNLRSLDLYHNAIEILQREVVDNIKNSKNEFFSFSFKENPYRCGCVMQWVSAYQKISNSRQFSRELEGVMCIFENGTMKMLEYLEKTDCKVSVIKPRLSPPLVTNLVTKSMDGVPVELNSQKSNPLATAAVADQGTEEAYLSDIVSERAKLGDDSSNPGGTGMNTQSFLIVFSAFLTLIIIKY